MDIEFLAHNMTLSQFASEAGRSTDTVADWRKRGMIDGYGQPHPNRNGQWVYSREDALAVHIASQIQSAGGYTWSVALEVGHRIARNLVARVMQSGTESGKFYDHRYTYVFDTSAGVFIYMGLSVEAAFAALPKDILVTPIARVVDVESIVGVGVLPDLPLAPEAPHRQSAQVRSLASQPHGYPSPTRRWRLPGCL